MHPPGVVGSIPTGRHRGHTTVGPFGTADRNAKRLLGSRLVILREEDEIFAGIGEEREEMTSPTKSSAEVMVSPRGRIGSLPSGRVSMLRNSNR